MAPTQLSIYNNALTQHLGERPLGSLTENRKPRRLLDAAWGNGAFIKDCLEQGYWKFAMRSVQGEASTSIEPEFGLRYAFDKPEDWVKTYAVSDTGFFDGQRPPPYADENGYWLTNWQTSFFKFVSDHADYGSNMSLWPESFTSFVEAALAYKVVTPITQGQVDKQLLKEEMLRLLSEAKSTDAMNGPAQMPPLGTWNRARRGGVGPRSSRREQW